MKNYEKLKAISLRRNGLSYSEILDQIKVSKGTLSLWLKDIKLTNRQEKRLEVKQTEKGRIRARAVQQYWEEQRKIIKENYCPPLNSPDFVFGLALYWGEGTKWSPSVVAMGNTDFRLLKYFIGWINTWFKGDFEKFTIQIHHHYDEIKDSEIIGWWSEKLCLPKSCFNKCFYIKQRKKGCKKFGNGIAYLRVGGNGVWRIRQKIDKAIESWLLLA